MKTTKLIDELSNQAGAKTITPKTIFSRWMVFSFIYILLTIYVLELRDDIMLRIYEPLFAGEILSLLMLGIMVGISSIILSYPDSYQKKFLVYAPVLPLISFVAIITAQAQNSKIFTEHLDGEIGCFICICIYAAGPGIYLFRQLMKNATTSPKLAGSMAMLAVFCFGAMAIRLTEKVDSMEHIILVHYLPLLAIAAIGMWAGRKLLKW